MPEKRKYKKSNKRKHKGPSKTFTFPIDTKGSMKDRIERGIAREDEILAEKYGLTVQEYRKFKAEQKKKWRDNLTKKKKS